MIIFVLGKVLPKVVQSRVGGEWTRFSKICLKVCQRVDSLELFLALRFLMSRQSSSPSMDSFEAGMQYEMAQSERSKELLMEIVRPCFFDFDDWPVELIESSIAQNVDPSETLEQVFRFRTLSLNYLQICPYQLVDHVYFRQVINSICAPGIISTMHASTVQTLLRQVIMNRLVPIFIKAQFSKAEDGSEDVLPEELLSTLCIKCSIQQRTQLFIELVKSSEISDSIAIQASSTLFTTPNELAKKCAAATYTPHSIPVSL